MHGVVSCINKAKKNPVKARTVLLPVFRRSGFVLFWGMRIHTPIRSIIHFPVFSVHFRWLVWFGSFCVFCCFGLAGVCPSVAVGVPVKLSQPVDGLGEFDTRHCSREVLLDLAVRLERDYGLAELANVTKIRNAIEQGDYHDSAGNGSNPGLAVVDPSKSPGSYGLDVYSAGLPWETGPQQEEGSPVLSAPTGLRSSSPVPSSGLYPSAEGFSQSYLQPDPTVQEVFRAPEPQVSVVAGSGGSGSTLVEDDPSATQLNLSEGVAVGGDGSVVIADSSNHRVLRVSGDGRRVSVVAGTGEVGSALVEADPLVTQLSDPGGVAVAGDGSVLIADTGNNRVLRVSADGREISVVVGIGECIPSDSSGTPLDGPTGIAVSPVDGAVLITDLGNHRVLRVSGDGRQVSVFVGTGTLGSSLGGLFKRTQLNDPRGVAVAGDGSVLIADTRNHRVFAGEWGW